MAAQATVLITGAAGNIGKKLRAHLQNSYSLKLIDKQDDGDKAVTVLDLSKWDDRLVDLFTGVDAVVHLAADPNEQKSWQELIAPNLDALNNVFVAAIKARVPRLVFASSNHVMGGYKDGRGFGRWLTASVAPKPGTITGKPSANQYNSTAYAAMKLSGERLGLCYAQATSGVCIAIRIGWVIRFGENRPQNMPAKTDPWFKNLWLSDGDLCQLMEQAIAIPKPPKSFVVVNGISNNKGMVWDIEEAKTQLGYNPKDGLK